MPVSPLVEITSGSIADTDRITIEDASGNTVYYGTFATLKTYLQTALVDLTISGDFTVGTNVLFVDVSTGLIGFGTGTPDAELDISASAPKVRLLSTGNTTAEIVLERASSTDYRLVNENGIFRIETGTDGVTWTTVFEFNNNTHRWKDSSGTEIGRFTSGGSFKITPTTVASLPSASTEGAGAKQFVTDATATTFASVVAGGGSNDVPVYSDGTNWRIG